MKKCIPCFALLALTAFLLFLASCGSGEIVDIAKDPELRDELTGVLQNLEDQIIFCSNNQDKDECRIDNPPPPPPPPPESSSSNDNPGEPGEESSSSAPPPQQSSSSGGSQQSSSSSEGSSSSGNSSSSGGSSSSGSSSSGGSSSSSGGSSSSSTTSSSSTQQSSSSTTSSSSSTPPPQQSSSSGSSSSQGGGGEIITVQDEVSLSGDVTIKCGSGSGSQLVCRPKLPCSGFDIKVDDTNKSIGAWNCSADNWNYQSYLNPCTSGTEHTLKIPSGETLNCKKDW